MSTATVEFAGIELLSPCPHCGAPMAINTLADRCRCSSCLMESALAPSVWDEALRDIDLDVVRFAAGYLRDGPEWGEGGPPPGSHVSWQRGRDAPPCPRCQRPMRPTLPGGCVCPGCGAGRAMLPRPPWLPAHIPVVGFVSDEPAMPERPREPVHVACTQCGGPLVADGSSRIVPCGYCSARVALSDAVWAALHPPRIKKRWWLAVHIAADPRRRPPSVDKFTGPAWGVAGILVPPAVIGVLVMINPSKESPDETLKGRMLHQDLVFGLSPLVLVFFVWLCLWLRGRWRYARICRHEHEVVGRLCDEPGAVLSTPVVLTPPHQPTVVLARARLWMIGGKRLAELGGVGGKVRAWMVPGNPRLVHVEPMPSVLE